jgi:hypothetical protein
MSLRFFLPRDAVVANRHAVRVSLRRRLAIDLAVGLLVAAIAMGVVYWQAATADPGSSSGHTFRLLCPLH